MNTILVGRLETQWGMDITRTMSNIQDQNNMVSTNWIDLTPIEWAILFKAYEKSLDCPERYFNRTRFLLDTDCLGMTPTFYTKFKNSLARLVEKGYVEKVRTTKSSKNERPRYDYWLTKTGIQLVRCLIMSHQRIVE
jgi:hypothetical protein